MTYMKKILVMFPQLYNLTKFSFQFVSQTSESRSGNWHFENQHVGMLECLDISSFYQFHVYITIESLHNEMLPNDDEFPA